LQFLIYADKDNAIAPTGDAAHGTAYYGQQMMTDNVLKDRM